MSLDLPTPQQFVFNGSARSKTGEVTFVFSTSVSDRFNLACHKVIAVRYNISVQSNGGV